MWIWVQILLLGCQKPYTVGNLNISRCALSSLMLWGPRCTDFWRFVEMFGRGFQQSATLPNLIWGSCDALGPCVCTRSSPRQDCNTGSQMPQRFRNQRTLTGGKSSLNANINQASAVFSKKHWVFDVKALTG